MMRVSVFMTVLGCLLLGLDTKVAANSNGIGFSVRKGYASDGFTIKASPFNVQFKDILANGGGGWKSASAEFIAPEAGGYFFTFNVMSSKTSDCTVALMLNSQYQVTAFAPKGYNLVGNSALLTLKKGDSVSLIVEDGAIYENPLYETYTTLSGFQVFKT